MALGGGLDVLISDMLAIRAFRRIIYVPASLTTRSAKDESR